MSEQQSVLEKSSEEQMPDCLLKEVNKLEGNECLTLFLRVDGFPYEETVYLPARVVRAMLKTHQVHPSAQFIITKKTSDPTKKIGYREDLVLYTKEQFAAEKIDIDKLINNDKVYIEQQMVWIKNFSRFGNKVAEIHELQEMDRRLSIVV
jgi:hypothetical protein